MNFPEHVAAAFLGTLLVTVLVTAISSVIAVRSMKKTEAKLDEINQRWGGLERKPDFDIGHDRVPPGQ